MELIADISTVLSVLLNLKEEVLIFSTLIYTKERKSSTEQVSFFTFTYQLETYESENPEESDFQQFFYYQIYTEFDWNSKISQMRMKLGLSKSVMLTNFSQNAYQMKLFPKNVFSTLIVNFLQNNDKKSNLKKKLKI